MCLEGHASSWPDATERVPPIKECACLRQQKRMRTAERANKPDSVHHVNVAPIIHLSNLPETLFSPERLKRREPRLESPI